MVRVFVPASRLTPWRMYGVPTLFAAGSCVVTFVAAGLVDRRKRLQATAMGGRTKSRLRQLMEKAGPLTSVSDAVQAMPSKLWNRLHPGHQTAIALMAANGLVFLAWKVPRLQNFMWRHFTHDAGTGMLHTMVTSMFSHRSLFHLGFNMFALYSFIAPVYGALGREQFLFMYITGGVIANYTSHVMHLVLRRPALSLGASGALYTVLVAFAQMYPHAQVTPIFMPFLPISIGTAVPALLCFDVVGAVSRITNMDHFGHLGGALGGYLFMEYGRSWWWRRDSLLAPLYGVVFGR